MTTPQTRPARSRDAAASKRALLDAAQSLFGQKGFEKTTIGALTVTAEGTFGAELIEFWPDIEHHFRKKHQPQP